MRARPDASTIRLLPLRALALYGVFLGAASAALRATEGAALGALLGPVAAQVAMGVVILVGARTLLAGAGRAVQAPSGRPAERPGEEPRVGTAGSPPQPLRVAPLVSVAVGGFLLQVTSLATLLQVLPSVASEAAGLQAVAGGAEDFLAPGGGETPEAWIFWTVLLLTSVVGAPVIEEVFFRGMLQPALSRRSALAGLVATAALFGMAHGFGTPVRMVPTFLEGLLLGGVMLLTGRLGAAILVHAVNNALVLLSSFALAAGPASLAGSQGGAPAAALAVYAAGALDRKSVV